jgi:hypothetical protein
MQAKPVRRFKKDEAESKLGKMVRSRSAFWKVPYGTTGQVVDTYEVSEGWYDVVIEWNLPRGESPQRDMFAKEPFEDFLIELEQEQSCSA